MAQLAIATVGAVVGGYIGGPMGASIGWSLGSMVGASFGPTITNDRGPISDLRYMDSSYGAPLAIHYGTVPASRAQVIWTPDEFRAVRNVESSGGKGGPRVENVTYTYETDVAIALSGRQCAGLGRIWVDNILRSNFRADATVDETMASAEWFDNLVFYGGAEDQEPDPTMEAALGVGEVPAYRGTCYVVITGVKCGASPRLPNMVFELIADGNAAPAGRIVAEEITGTNSFYNVSDDGHVGIPTLRFENGFIVWQRDGDTAAIVVDPDGTEQTSVVLSDLNGFPSGATVGATPNDPLVYHESFYCALVQFTPSGAAYYFGYNDIGSPIVYFAAGATLTPQVSNLSDLPSRTGDFLLSGNAPVAAAGCADRRYCLFWYPGNDWAIWRLDPEIEIVRQGTTEIESGDNWYVPYGICCSAQQDSYQWAAACLESNLLNVWIVGANETFGRPGEIFCYEIGADDVMRRVYYYWSFGDPGNPTAVSCYADNGLLHVMFSVPAYHETGYYRVHSRLQAASGTVALSTVVADLYSRTGYEQSADLDVDALTQTVDGYEFATPRPVRAGIEELRAAYLFDLVESEGLIVGVNRGGAASASITQDDLGMSDDGSIAPAIETTRETESEVPFEVVVKYVSKDGAYRAGAQRAENASTSSNEQLTIDLPLVLADDRAAELADILRRDRWRSRTTHLISTSRKHLAIDPADVVTVNDGEATRTLRVTGQKLSGGRLELELVDEGAAEYESNAVGGSVNVPYQPLLPIAYTNFTLIDAPLLRPAQNEYGLLLAARGYQEGWTGASLFKSADASTWTLIDSTSVAAVIGYATTALPAPATTTAIPDESSVVTVSIPTSLSLSSTDMDGLLSLKHVAAIQSGTGWEIVSWRDVTDNGDGTWKLAGLVRGLAGTESYMDGHAAGDRFVVLDYGSLAWVPHSAVEVGQVRYYRAPAFGQSINQSVTRSLTFSAATLKPLSPVHVSASRLTAGGDIRIAWTRRGRIDHLMRDYWSEGALDEDAESYAIEVYDAAGTLLRTLTSATTYATYTSAQQDADFDDGEAIAYLNLNIYQVSTRVGRGFPASVRVPVSLNILWARDWDDGLLSNQTTFIQSGGSFNTYTAASGALRVASSASRVVWIRMDAAPQIADGFLQADVALEQSTSAAYAILVYRTASAAFGNSQGCFAYRVAMNSGTVYLERGQNNAGGGAVTTIASASISTTANVAGVLLVQFQGSSHRVWFNDSLVIDETDATYTGAGAIGVGAQSDADIVVSRIDNLTVFTN